MIKFIKLAFENMNYQLKLNQILDEFEKKDISLDSHQKDITKKILLLAIKIKDETPFRIFTKTEFGLYLHGSVGRGKTLITRTILDHVFKNYLYFHYADFLKYIRSELENLKSNKNPLKKIVSNLQTTRRVIFIDEFQVEDIADAMILSDVIPSLIKKRSKIFFTSNFPIKGLYPNGLQRDKFINSMSVLRDKLNYFQLRGDLDYRLRNIINQHSKESSMIEIQSFIESLFITDVKQINEFYVNDRKFPCLSYSNEFLWLSYIDFFKVPVGYEDFKKIFDKYKWLFISEFQQLNDDNVDLVRRFITFIDLAYTQRINIKLFLKHEQINNLYQGNLLKDLWVRTSSRLVEMSSPDYLTTNQ